MLPLVLPVPVAPLSEKLPNSGNQLWLLELSPLALGVVLKVLTVLPLELEEQLSLLLETLLLVQLGLLQGLVVALALSEPMLLLSLNITTILVKLVVLLTLSLSLSLNLSYWLSFNLLILSMSSLEK